MIFINPFKQERTQIVYVIETAFKFQFPVCSTSMVLLCEDHTEFNRRFVTRTQKRFDIEMFPVLEITKKNSFGWSIQFEFFAIWWNSNVAGWASGEPQMCFEGRQTWIILIRVAPSLELSCFGMLDLGDRNECFFCHWKLIQIYFHKKKSQNTVSPIKLQTETWFPLYYCGKKCCTTRHRSLPSA